MTDRNPYSPVSGRVWSKIKQIQVGVPLGEAVLHPYCCHHRHHHRSPHCCHHHNRWVHRYPRQNRSLLHCQIRIHCSSPSNEPAILVGYLLEAFSCSFSFQRTSFLSSRLID